MDFAKWLDRHGWTDRGFAERIGVGRESVRLYRAGLRRPSAPVLAAVERETGGLVREADFERAYRKAHEKPRC